MGACGEIVNHSKTKNSKISSDYHADFPDSRVALLVLLGTKGKTLSAARGIAADWTRGVSLHQMHASTSAP